MLVRLIYSSTHNHGWNEQYFTESFINNIEIKQYEDSEVRINESHDDSINQSELEDHSNLNVGTTTPSMMKVSSSFSIHHLLQPLKTVRTAKSIHLNDIIIRKTIMKGDSIHEVVLETRERIYFQTLIKFLYEMKFLSIKKIKNGRLNFVESVIINDNRYRCNLSFYGDKEWFDWVNVDWRKDGYIKTYPAKLLGIIDSEFFIRNNSIDELHPIFPSDRYWAIIQTTDEEDRSKYNTSNLSTVYNMVHDEATIISLKRITGPAFIIPDIVENVISSSDSNPLLESRKVISMSPKTKWPNLFMNHKEEPIDL